MRELILGGARSGKSLMAEQLALATDKKLIYIATATVLDSEMANRVKHHQDRRGERWQLVEEPYALADKLQRYEATDHCILVDCLTLWLTNLLMLEDDRRFEKEVQALLDAISDYQGHVIFVSNEVGLGIVPLGEINRRFVDETGFLHQAIGKICDRVVFMIAGIPQVLKGASI